MPRSASPDRLDQIVAAGVRVFAARGYRRTLMSDVATEAGLSPGALYRYVEGKDALFRLLFTHNQATPQTLPAPTPTREALIDSIVARLAVLAATPALDAALSSTRPPADIEAEVRAVVSERYDLVANNWQLLAVVERSSMDLSELFDVYFTFGRRELTGKMARYLAARHRQRRVRLADDPFLVARFIEESLTWFAWHRHSDPDPQHLDDGHARRAAIECSVTLLLPTDATSLTGKTPVSPR
jgi:AcrR family transcriptional regulator